MIAIDNIDRALLRELQNNGSAKASELAYCRIIPISGMAAHIAFARRKGYKWKTSCA